MLSLARNVTTSQGARGPFPTRCVDAIVAQQASVCKVWLEHLCGVGDAFVDDIRERAARAIGRDDDLILDAVE